MIVESEISQRKLSHIRLKSQKKKETHNLRENFHVGFDRVSTFRMRLSLQRDPRVLPFGIYQLQISILRTGHRTNLKYIRGRNVWYVQQQRRIHLYQFYRRRTVLVMILLPVVVRLVVTSFRQQTDAINVQTVLRRCVQHRR